MSLRTLLKIDEIRQLIYTLRGLQVMLDSDLADLYGIEAKAMNQAVKRNIERFPIEFMFQLTADEYDTLRSQIVTSNPGKKWFAFSKMDIGAVEMLGKVGEMV